MVKIQRVIERARIILNSDDAVKTINRSILTSIPVADPPVVFDSTSGTIIDTANSTILYNDHQFSPGEAIVYTAGTTAIGGLTTATTYYAIPMTPSTFRLATTQANAVATPPVFITLTGVGAGSHFFRRDVTFNGSQAAIVDVALNVINITGHNFQTGDVVQYIMGTTNIGGLVNNAYYYVFRATADILSLVRNYEDLALDPVNAIPLLALGTGTSHILRRNVQVDTVGSPNIDANREWINIPAHGYQTGDMVQYKIEAGNTAIAPLVDNNFYYVILQDADTFRLALSYDLATAGNAINITAFGTGNAHSFTKTVIRNVPVCTNYKFKLDNQSFVLNDKCRLSVQSFDYVKNYNASLCKSVGGVYIKSFLPTDTFSSQGYYKGTLLLPAYFGNNITYQNNNLEFNSIQLPNNTAHLLQNGLDIFIDSKKRNTANQDISGNINEDRFNLSLVIYEVDDYEYINVDLNEKVQNYNNSRLV